MAEPHIPVRRDRLRCRICSKVLSNPVTILCGHNFCMLCIQEKWDNEERNNHSCSCPECSRTFLLRPPLIENTTLAGLVTDAENSDVGVDTEREQDSSTGPSGEPPSPKRPRTSTEQEASGSLMCLKHEIPMKVYCCSDEQIICAMCAFDDHKGHQTELASEAHKRKQEELANMKKKSQEILCQQEKELKKMRDAHSQIEFAAKNAERHCESVLAKVIDSIKRHCGSAKELIGEKGRTTTAQVQEFLQTLDLRIAEIRQTNAELDRLAHIESDVHFLQEWPSVTRLCDNNDSYEVSKDPLRPFESIKKAAEQLRKQLEAFCDKEFATFFQTVNSIRTGEAAEPETRAEFLEYACELSLDPNTAHKDLVLSNGGKEVMLCPQNQKKPAVRHPEQFIVRQQVLCKEGLQAERCYYEVEVEGEKAEIALTYKSIDRKSQRASSAFGGNANSWSLDRSKTYSVSHKNDSIQLTATPSHHKIGVYLKFKEGTLTFYEVSDSMKFLYKIEATFTEPLYPGFWLGEKCCIRLCNLRQGRLYREM